MKLDLGVLKQDNLEITLLDGRTLEIKKPSKGLLIELNKAEIEFTGTKEIEKIVNKLEEIVAKILSNNTEKETFKTSQIEEMEIDYSMQLAIFKAYMQFISKVASNPN